MGYRSDLPVLLFTLGLSIWAPLGFTEPEAGTRRPSHVLATRGTSVLFRTDIFSPKVEVKETLYVVRGAKLIAVIRVASLGPGIARGVVTDLAQGDGVKAKDVVSRTAPPGDSADLRPVPRQGEPQGQRRVPNLALPKPEAEPVPKERPRVLAVRPGSLIFVSQGFAPQVKAKETLYVVRGGEFIAVIQVTNLGPGIARGRIVKSFAGRRVEVKDIVTREPPPPPVPAEAKRRSPRTLRRG